jgi:uncharacterized membrane protein YcaP (DUF421 family)
MQGFIDTVFGHGKDLNALQMACRAFVLFFVALVLVRIAGMRAFARRSSFDTVILVGLGTVIMRAIYGASPAIPIIAASTVLVIVHRVVGMVTARMPVIERVVKGRASVIYRDGELDTRTMHRAGISASDLDEAARSKAKAATRRDVHEIQLEADGELTVIEQAGQ